MGQKQSNPYLQYEKQYSLVSKNQKQQHLVRHKQNGKQYLLRRLLVRTEQQLQQTMSMLSKRKKIKSQHLLNIVDYKPLINDKICGDTKYISLLIQYPFQSMQFETQHRINHPITSHRSSAQRISPLYFQEHQLWSILYSCALALEVLYLNDLPHQSITKEIVFIDKEGVVKIGDPIILDAHRNYQRVMDGIEQLKKKQTQSQIGILNKTPSLSSSSFYPDSNQTNLKKLNHIKQSTIIKQSPHHNNIPQNNQSSQVIISPELISYCKDRQHYFYDKQKSDVYVLGALVIQLSLLQNVASINIRQNSLKKDLAQYTKANGGRLRQKYSNSFVSLLEEMTKIDPKQRPSLSQIVQKIEEFSIQENSRSNVHNNSTGNNQLPDGQDTGNKNFNDIFKKKDFAIGDSNFAGYGHNPHSVVANEKGGVNSIYQYNNINSSYVPSVTNSFNYNANNLAYTPNQSDLISYPTFSLNNNNNNTNSIKDPNNQHGYYHQSAVKSLFSKQPLPVQIKYTQSPLILPVTNIKHNKKIQTFSTPFNHLNLTQSNQKNRYHKQAQKQSIVQNKFTLNGLSTIGGGVKGLFDKEYGTQNAGQRFSMNKFGKIQMPNNNYTSSNSNTTSIHTSTMPTPRFQNVSNTYIIQPKYMAPVVNPDIYRPLGNTFYNNDKSTFNNSPLSATLNKNQNFSYLNNNSGINSFLPSSMNNNLNQYSKPALNQQKSHYSNFENYASSNGGNISSNNNNYNVSSNYSSINTSYNPKRQGFSIIDEKDFQKDKKNQKEQPYFSNSSVGYTLPKYRPESASSEVVKNVNHMNYQINHKQNNNNSYNNHPESNNNFKSYNANSSYRQQDSNQPTPVQKIITVESFIQKVELPQPHKELIRNSSNASSMINAISSLANEPNDDAVSNSSSQNTVKKQNPANNTNNSGKKHSSQKKYNFYKTQMSQKLQKIQQSSSHINHSANSKQGQQDLSINSKQAKKDLIDKKIQYQPDKQNSLSHISSISVLQQVSPQKASERNEASNQNMYSPIYQQNASQQNNLSHQNLASQQTMKSNSIIPIVYQPQIHSIYVQQQLQDGSFYKGFKLNNKKEGNGLLYFIDGGYYDGQFNDDMMSGFGKLYYNQKDIAYEGQFLKSCFHGYGVLYNDKPKQLEGKFDFANMNAIGDYWRVFKGYFKNDQKAGKCTIIFTNGQEFEGVCQYNTIYGVGRFKTLEGDIIDGIWKNNVLIQILNQGRIQNCQNSN